MVLVMAAVPKGAFENAARAAGGLGPGRVWAIDELAASSPCAANSVEALYLVTVRPHLNRVWMVGILRSPSHDGKVWRAEPNTTPIQDITALWHRLAFAEGDPKPEVAAPASSLRKPRILEANSARALPSPDAAAKPSLRRANLRRISDEGELTPMLAKQLQIAGKNYDGLDLPVSARLADDDSETSFRSSLVFSQLIGAKGKPVYDVLTYAGDSGCIFAAGSVKLVAQIIQGYVQCSDPKLRSTLDAALKASVHGGAARSKQGKVSKAKAGRPPAKAKQTPAKTAKATKRAKAARPTKPAKAGKNKQPKTR